MRWWARSMISFRKAAVSFLFLLSIVVGRAAEVNSIDPRSGVGVCLALRTLVREVKRTLAIVGSWIGPLSIKYGFDSRAPQQK